MIESRLSEQLHLDSSERRRLAAHLDWLLTNPPGMRGVKKRVEVLDQEQREAIGRFLIHVALEDGKVEPNEVKSLTKLFRTLGLDPGSVHQELHMAQSTAGANGPIAVVNPDSAPRSYAIPSAPKEAANNQDLDLELIKRKREQTNRVANLLSEIFEDDDVEVSAPVSGGEVDGIHGLDENTTQFAPKPRGKAIVVARRIRRTCRITWPNARWSARSG